MTYYGLIEDYEYNQTHKRHRMTIWSGPFASVREGEAYSLPNGEGYMVTLEYGDKVRVECPVPRNSENYEEVDRAFNEALNASKPERVIFRKFPHNGEIIALFPDQYNERTGGINSYMHNGQHAETAPDFGDTKAAEPGEYYDLQQELMRQGYGNLRPVKRFGKLGRK